MRELIKTLLGDIVRRITLDFKGGILVEVPGNKEHGDYTTNVAFALSKILSARGGSALGGKKSPQEIAEYLVNKLKKQKVKDFSKIERESERDISRSLKIKN